MPIQSSTTPPEQSLSPQPEKPYRDHLREETQEVIDIAKRIEATFPDSAQVEFKIAVFMAAVKIRFEHVDRL